MAALTKLMSTSSEPAAIETPRLAAEPSLQPFVEQTRRRVDAALDRLLPAESTSPAKVHAAIRWSIFAGGKRFRPILLFAVGETFGASPELLIETACALEMIHTYSLIHDDLPSMDDDDLRRGKPTVHKAFDEATAILAGDALQSLAFELLSMMVSVRGIANPTSLRERVDLTLAAPAGARP